jgi:hypothetical protein
MESKKCFCCGNTDKDGDLFMYKLKDGNFICFKCLGNMSEKEHKELFPKLESMSMTESDIANTMKLQEEAQGKKVIRIVSWNCHYGLKLEKYLDISDNMKYYPQVLIIQECAKNDFDYIKDMWKYKNWYNDELKDNNSNLGLAIFSNDYKILFTEIFNRNYRYVIPYTLSSDKYKFTLFSVWINPIDGNYEKVFYEAIEYYRDKKMFDNHPIIIGDFNTFAKDENNLKDLENLENKLHPLVNCTKNTRFWGKPTYYHEKNKYGINDFCFLGEDIVKNFEINVNIPDEWDEEKDKAHHWKGLSDHSPVIVEVSIK